MKWYWINDKEPDENGDIELRIDNAQGQRVSGFKGKTEAEVLVKLADSQVNANLRIAGLMKPDKSGRQTVTQEAKTLTSEDRLRLSEQITDPERVVEAVEEIVTARMGITPERVGGTLANMSREQQDQYFAQEAGAFRTNTPDFYPTVANRDALFAYLQQQGWDLTRNNLALAYSMLNEQGSLTPWPSDEERETERHFIASQQQPPNGTDNGGTNGAATAEPAPPPSTRARTVSISSGLRGTDATALPPKPPKLTPRYTRADIEKMGRAEFNEKLQNERGFRELVNAM
jgi:hypothetical protein